MSDDHEAGKDGDPASGLPPQAPAYDLRTGEALDAPRGSESGSAGGSADFTTSDLGIWAPSRDEPGANPSGGTPQYPPASYQPTDPPGYPASSRQPTPPPGYGQAGYQPTPPPGYGQTPYQPTTPQYPYGTGGYPPGGAAPTGHQPGPPPPRRGGAVLATCVGVLVVVVAILVAVLVFHGSSKTPVASTSSGSPQTTSSGSAKSNQSGVTSGGSNDAARLAFLRTVDGILTQSSSGRQQVSSAVTGVVNGCSVTPADASATIQQVLVNRQSVLAQANALDPVDGSTSAVKSDLIQSLNDSIDASSGYQRWLDNINATYVNADPVGCPGGQAPTDSNYDAATAASGRATSAKQNFVAVYNPQASSVGLRTWQESEF